jgi:hypothetical protein
MNSSLVKERPADPSTYIFPHEKSTLSTNIDFLREACRYALDNSDDAITKNGVIIVTKSG